MFHKLMIDIANNKYAIILLANKCIKEDIMVEFAIGKAIKSRSDKLIVAAKGMEAAQLLSDKEQNLLTAVKKQTPEDKIKAYDLGDYTVFVAIKKMPMSAVDWQKFGGEVWQKIKKCREVKAALLKAPAQALYDFALGMELAAYSFDKYFTKKPASFYPNLEKVIFTNSKLKDFAGYKANASLANAVRYARDLINEPANAMTPEILAADIKRLEYLGLEVEILTEEEMQNRGFNLALAVAQGSANRPRVAVIKWHGDKKKDGYTVGLVGKGVTFDSGGISIKPAANMGDMKQDMTGAAVMAATMKSIALQKVNKNVVAVVGLVENMPSGTAYRPGDVIKSMSGQTVEVVNTDAEGRLVLADCLTYIQQEYKPQYVVDAATLTGAIMVALGGTFAGLFANHQGLANHLKDAGEVCGERLWQMPMDKEYDAMMDSPIADMKNAGGRLAGSATAACFLQRFINKNTKWAHLDVAGMDMSDGKNVLTPKGASAFGVRLLNKFISSL